MNMVRAAAEDQRKDRRPEIYEIGPRLLGQNRGAGIERRPDARSQTVAKMERQRSSDVSNC
jgi:hypothetical protein